MRQIQWERDGKGGWIWNAAPYLVAKVKRLGPPGSNGESAFKIEIIGAQTVNTTYIAHDIKQAREAAFGIMCDWVNSTGFILARPLMARPMIC